MGASACPAASRRSSDATSPTLGVRAGHACRGSSRRVPPSYLAITSGMSLELSRERRRALATRIIAGRRRRQQMRGSVKASLATLIGLAMLGTVVAQAQQQPSAPRPAPPAARTTADLPKEKHVEGTVSKVDPLARTVGVSSGL